MVWKFLYQGQVLFGLQLCYVCKILLFFERILWLCPFVVHKYTTHISLNLQDFNEKPSNQITQIMNKNINSDYDKMRCFVDFCINIEGICIT